MKKVFAVDDSASIRVYIEHKLKEAGFQVSLAEDGDIALEHLQSRNEEVDIFVIDVVMKKMNGITLMKHIRDMDKFANTPIIVLTNLSDMSIIEEARELGASCWITKPFEARQLIEAIENLAS